MTYYSIKRLFKNGIESHDGRSNGEYVYVAIPGSYWTDRLKIGRDIFTDRASAVAAALKAIEKKRKSIAKQLAKIDDLEVSLATPTSRSLTGDAPDVVVDES